MNHKLSQLQDAFLGLLSRDQPMPDGLRWPIASGPKRRPASMRNVETLLANFLHMKNLGKRSLAVSLSPNTYASGKVNAGFIDLVKLASHPTRQALILQKGFRDAHSGRSRRTRVKPGREFSELLDTFYVDETEIINDPNAMVGLRRSKSKDFVPRDEWNLTPAQEAYVIRLEAMLTVLNATIGEVEMTYIKASDDETHYLYPALYVVYTNDFEHGGRFYTGKGGHQGLTKAERRTIKFDGCPTVELDFSGLHVRMLYHLAGKEYSANADPYAAVLETIGHDSATVFKRWPSIRDDLKEMLLALINGKTKSTKQAIARANRRMFSAWRDAENDHHRDLERKECRGRVRRWAKAGLLDSPDTPSCATVLKGFYKAHKSIRRYFDSGMGLRLQNLDAQMARLIMLDMLASHRAVVLPIHDSFIVEKYLEQQLRHVMQRVYNLVMTKESGRAVTSKVRIKRG